MRQAHSRVFGLDLLRAFAILCVVYEHGYDLLNHAIPKATYNLPLFDGVTMFFVLSGFLIGRILLKTLTQTELNSATLLEFWVRRWFRTLPNYLLVLSLLLIANTLSDQPRPDHIMQYFCFAQNIATPHPDFFPEAWSLTVEEWFYLCIPIPLYLSAKWRRFDQHKLTLAWIGAVIIAVTVFRIYRAHHFGYALYNDWDDALRKQVVTRLDSLMFGVLGAYFYIYHANMWRKMANQALVLGIALLLFDKAYLHTHSMFYLNYFSLTLSAVGTLLLLPKLSTLHRKNSLFVRVINIISLISYSMYLLNYTPVQGFILPLLMRPMMRLLWDFGDYIIWIRYVMYWLVTLICSCMLYQYFERPMTALRERWPIRGRPVATTIAAI